MNNLNFYLLASTMPDWVTNSFPIIRIVLVSITALCALCVIATTLMQSNENNEGANALSGGSQESYYAQNKGESKNVKLSRATIILASTMVLCMILYFVTLLILPVSV